MRRLCKCRYRNMHCHFTVILVLHIPAMLKNIASLSFLPFLRQVAASILIIIGILVTFLPIPIGLVLVISGFSLMAYDSKRLVRRIRIFRRRQPVLSEKLIQLEQKNIWFFSEILKRTNPANSIPPQKKHDFQAKSLFW